VEPSFVSEKRGIMGGPPDTFGQVLAAKAPYLSIERKKREASLTKKRGGHARVSMNKFGPPLRGVTKSLYGQGPNSAANPLARFKNECVLSGSCKLQCRHQSRGTSSYNEDLFLPRLLRFNVRYCWRMTKPQHQHVVSLTPPIGIRTLARSVPRTI
jgi:hypothetical protein